MFRVGGFLTSFPPLLHALYLSASARVSFFLFQSLSSRVDDCFQRAAANKGEQRCETASHGVGRKATAAGVQRHVPTTPAQHRPSQVERTANSLFHCGRRGVFSHVHVKGYLWAVPLGMPQLTSIWEGGV